MSALAHQLRTPLALMTGYAELLALRADEQTRRDASEAILIASARLTDGVDDVLVVLALDAGWLEFDPVALDLRGPVDEALRAAASRYPEHSFAASADVGEWPVVWADPEHVTRVVKAFASALCRAAPESGAVVVSAEHDDAVARISVTHSTAQLGAAGAVFDVDPSDRAPLERYKARRLVELHGGSVAADSDGGATRLSFTLRLADDAEA